MKIALLFDGAAALGKSADLLILETVEAVEAVLAAEGNQVVRVPVNTDGRWIERTRRTKCDVAFNLCEGIDGVAELEPTVISALEVLGIPFTGSSSWTASLWPAQARRQRDPRSRAPSHPALRDLERRGQTGLRVEAHPLQHVGPVEGGRGHLDHDLLGTRHRIRHLLDPEHLGSTLLIEDDGSHDGSIAG